MLLNYTITHSPVITQRTSYPMLSKVMPRREPKFIPTEHGFVTSAEGVYRLHYLDRFHYTIYLTDGRGEQVVKLQPAQGQPLRRPEIFTAVVRNEETGRVREISVRDFQPLSVRG